MVADRPDFPGGDFGTTDGACISVVGFPASSGRFWPDASRRTSPTNRCCGRASGSRVARPCCWQPGARQSGGGQRDVTAGREKRDTPCRLDPPTLPADMRPWYAGQPARAHALHASGHAPELMGTLHKFAGVLGDKGTLAGAAGRAGAAADRVPQPVPQLHGDALSDRGSTTA